MNLGPMTVMTAGLRRQLSGSTAWYAECNVHRSISSPEPPGEVGTVFFPSYRDVHGQIEVEDLLEGTQEDLAEPRFRSREAGSRAPANSFVESGREIRRAQPGMGAVEGNSAETRGEATGH